MATKKQTIDPALKKSMQASLKAYSNGDSKFFTFVSNDVRVYGINSAEPIVGLKAFQSDFGANFSKHKRAVKVLAQDVQGEDAQAILSQTLEVASGGVTSFVRQTVVWQRADAGWQMTHIHNSFVGEPIATGRMPTTARGIKVLNDRIATAAAVVGVAQ